jgi:hypothetical protein
MCWGRANRSRNDEAWFDTETPGYDIRVLIGVERMKNVTITLDDAIASRTRVEAASRGQSLSKFVGELIEREIEPKVKVERKEMTDLEAIRDFLSGPEFLLPGRQSACPPGGRFMTSG